MGSPSVAMGKARPLYANHMRILHDNAINIFFITFYKDTFHAIYRLEYILTRILHDQTLPLVTFLYHNIQCNTAW